MKVLVIEDDVQITQLLCRGLGKGSFVVECAGTAEEGLTAIGNGHFDVVVLDIHLPDMNGMALCSQLRRQGVKTPVLMLTARDSVADKVDGLTAGADDYLTKPFAFDELKARLIALGRRSSEFVDTEALQARHIAMYPSQMKVLVHGQPLELTPKEFAVLELLVRNKGHVLSREIILDRVWGSEVDPVANVVDAVIARMRTKFKPIAKGGSLVKTVRGLGYKVEA